MWAIAVAAKRPLARLLNRRLGLRFGQVWLAASQGALSAGLELSAAGLYLWRLRSPNLLTVLGFGVGAGCAEVFYVIGMGFVAVSNPESVAAWARTARDSLCVRYQVPLERFVALLGHAGSRGLVYLGLRSPSYLVTAFVLFSATDGLATYGHLRHWQWSDASVCRRTHGFFAVVSTIELIVFLLGFR